MSTKNERQKEAGGSRSPRALRFVWMAALTLMIGAAGACEGLLEVELPGDITQDELLDPSMAEIWTNSAIGRAECAIQAYIHWDENSDVWWRGIGYQGGAWEYRLRPNTVTTCGRTGSSYGWYVPMQVARAENERVYDAHQEWTVEEVPDRERTLAISATFAGYTYQLLGERMCELTVDLGPLMTPDEVQTEAESWFTQALTHISAAGGDFELPSSTSSMQQTALLGRARARFAKGDFVGAADDANAIQPGFVAYITRDDSEHERRNHIYDYGYNSIQATVARRTYHPFGSPSAELIPFTGYYEFNDEVDAQDRPVVHALAIGPEGRNNVDQSPIFEYDAGAVADPRVPLVMTNLIIPGTGIPIVSQWKYQSIDAPIPLARWAEAQLILADIAHANGDLPTAIGHVDALRDVHGLPNYTVPSPTAQEVKDLIIEERRREFFLEGRFGGTKIREDLWFPLGEGSVPTGYPYQEGTCMLMPEVEYELNPNLADSGGN